ncbi:hypothetical protein F511_47082 [Dorcoceras hygrometricum]|uniref:Uncharacterized protein n=1 Tax=Dorcoceras hygrometricum TaxID=472368 RepID=A0A2Z6ZRW9_9LAMI|nr:hypothetical protein F511_47082 [Dorcoceras hygrometricum]
MASEFWPPLAAAPCNLLRNMGGSFAPIRGAVLRGGRPAVRHPWRAVSREVAALGAAACGHVPHAIVGDGHRRAAAVRRSSDSDATANLLLGFSSGLSRAAREVFGPIFDIGPVFGRY